MQKESRGWIKPRRYTVRDVEIELEIARLGCGATQPTADLLQARTTVDGRHVCFFSSRFGWYGERARALALVRAIDVASPATLIRALARDHGEEHPGNREQLELDRLFLAAKQEAAEREPKP